MFSSLNSQIRQMLMGDLLLTGCLVFYLAWWLVAFRPVKPINGFKSGWLLIPAFLLGVCGVAGIIRTCSGVESEKLLLGYMTIGIGGLVLYLILMAVTTLFFGRIVTSELIIMTGWATLMFVEISALYGLGRFGLPLCVIFLIIIVLALAASVVCYVLFYNLDAARGFIDGTIPLVLGLAVMVILSLTILFV